MRLIAFSAEACEASLVTLTALTSLHITNRSTTRMQIVSVCGHNILCIGGAISIDREHRMKQQASHAFLREWAEMDPTLLDVIHRRHPIQDAGHYGIL